MKLKRKLLISVIFLALLDTVIPIPFFAIFLLYVIIKRPGFFMDWVKEVYQPD